MRLTKFRKLGLLLVLSTTCLTSASGCCYVRRCLGFEDPCADIPPGAIPQPPGTYSCAWQTAHMAAAEADDFVFYQYEWGYRNTELSPFGQRHLLEVAARLAYEPLSVVIARSDDAGLDEARREVLIRQLAELGVSDAESRVSVDWPTAEPMLGRNAARIDAGYFGGSARIGSQGAGIGGNQNIGSFGGGRSGF